MKEYTTTINPHHFIIRLKALVEKRMKESGLADVMISNTFWDEREGPLKTFFDSLDESAIEYLKLTPSHKPAQ